MNLSEALTGPDSFMIDFTDSFRFGFLVKLVLERFALFEPDSTIERDRDRLRDFDFSRTFFKRSFYFTYSFFF